MWTRLAVLVGCTASSLPTPAPAATRDLDAGVGSQLSGRLAVTSSFDPSGGTPIEGFLTEGCVFMRRSDRRRVQAAARRIAARRARRAGISVAPARWRARCRLGPHSWSCGARSPGDRCQGELYIRGKPGRLRLERAAIGCGAVRTSTIPASPEGS